MVWLFSKDYSLGFWRKPSEKYCIFHVAEFDISEDIPYFEPETLFGTNYLSQSA